jgi:disulfide bond formation protein DsbB
MNNVERSPGEDLHGTAWMLVLVGWWIAGLATLGALFLSEYMQFVPCMLCWYQRIFMFPLVPILLVGLFTYDRRVLRYALALAVIGWLIAVFHLLLIAGVVPEGIKPCTQGMPCSEVQITWFGFVTIPLLSFATFSVINALLILAHVKSSK